MSTDFPFCLRMALGLSVLVVSTGMGAEAARAAAARDAAEVQLIGRAEHSAAGHSAGVWRVTWPGVGWRTAFSGSRVGVTTQDTVGYAVTIDGLRMNPIPPSQDRQTTWYRGLATGNHIIEVIRMRATPRAPGLFFGFSKDADGRWLALPPKPGRQIEFIADSGSTGYGDLSATVDCTDDESRRAVMRAKVMRLLPRTSCTQTGSSMPWMASVWCAIGMASGKEPAMRLTPR
jgi:hypothetical protein